MSEFIGFFAVLDDNSKEIRFLKNYLSDVLCRHNGWLIFAGTQENKDLFKDIIDFDNSLFGCILINEKSKKSVPATPIDGLFEKYMGRDPIVPFDMDKRKEKFPSLFDDYQDVINQYQNKKYK